MHVSFQISIRALVLQGASCLAEWDEELGNIHRCWFCNKRCNTVIDF